MQFGPEVSWPHGFRRLDTGARRALESAYHAPDYGQGEPGFRGDGGAGSYGPSGYGTGFAYQQPAIDDYGYGDPGYSDPSYDGPRSPHTGAEPVQFAAGPGYPGSPGRGWNPPGPETGYHAPGPAEPAAPAFFFEPPSPGSQDIYPVTGAQEALPDTGYPDEWYGRPRMADRVPDDPRPAAPRASDPRLEGIRYDELHYDEPDGPEYAESLDDEAWYRELRRSDPAYPHGAGDDQRRVDPQAFYPQRESGPDPQPGTGPQLGAGRGFGPGPGSPDGAGPDAGSGPRMTARMQPDSDTRPAFPRDGFLGAPTPRVGVLTPPPGAPVEHLPDDGPFLAGPSAAPFLAPAGAGRQAPAVRPGHGLDGPEITSSWPAQPSYDLDSFDEFWQHDDGEGDYSRLFVDEAGPDGAAAKAGTKRGTGRRRGRSNDHRLWLALGGVVITTAAAITGIIKFEFPSHGGPTHSMATPAKIGSYVRTVDLERQTKLAELTRDVIKMSSGQASRVTSAVYESGNSAAGGTVQILMFIGGHLANAAPAASITGFTQQFPGAKVVGAGPLGGQASCVEEAAGSSNSKSICVWFDNDSFGEIVSPTMNATTLANVMLTIRPSVETVVKK